MRALTVANLLCAGAVVSFIALLSSIIFIPCDVASAGNAMQTVG
jgi:hypothetical protein